jgi:DNA-binding response OmpR family regulator
MQILVADDSTVTRRIVASLLTRWGFEVVEATDGVEAYQWLARADGPSLAIIDWQMPRMDGTQVCRKVRENAATRPLHLILLTGQDTASDVSAGIAAGANDYVTKPFQSEELQVRVQVGVQVLELRQRLAQREAELGSALQQVKQLRELLDKEAACRR